MSIFASKLPPSWKRHAISTDYRVTKKPRGLARDPGKPVPFIRMEHIPTGGQTECRFELRKPSAIASGTYFEAGDVLLSKITPSFENGKQGLAIGLPEKYGFGSTELIPLQRCTDEAVNLYLFYLLLHHEVRNVLVSKMEGSTGRQRVPESAVRELEIPIPPKTEQEKIAAVLWKLQRAIAIQDRLIAATRHLKQSAMQRLFTHGLRGESLKDTEIGPIPESWTVICLGDAYETQLGKMLSQKARVGDQPKPYLRNKNVQWGRLDLSDLLVMDFNDREAARFRLVPGDLLVCEGGVIGRAAIWRGELGECYYQKAIHRIRSKGDATSNEFLCYWLSFSFEQQNLYNIGGASSTIAHLPQVLLAGLKVPLPAIDEQRDIAAALATIDRKLAHHQRKRAALNDLFQTALHLLMTAQVRVADLDIDTSEVTASVPKGEAA